MKRSYRLITITFFSIACIILGNKAKASQMNVQWVTLINNSFTYKVELQVACPTSGSPHYLFDGDFFFEVDLTSLNLSSFSGSMNSTFASSGGYTGSTVSDQGTGYSGGNYEEYSIQIGTPASTGVDISGGGWFTVATLSWSITSSSGSTTINWDESAMGPLVGANNTNPSIFETSGANYDEGSSQWSSFSVSSLPITLSNFSAFIDHNAAQINWTTSSEINNAYFTVERSPDGKNFVELFNRDGADNSNMKINYTAYDEQPLPGVSYYRLKQTDFNGASVTFNIVSVFNPVVGEFSISSVSPTSFSDNATLYYKIPAEGTARLVVRDMIGRVVEDVQIASPGGDNKYQLNNIRSWMPGMYIATMYYDGRESYIKLIKN